MLSYQNPLAKDSFCIHPIKETVAVMPRRRVRLASQIDLADRVKHRLAQLPEVVCLEMALLKDQGASLEEIFYLLCTMLKTNGKEALSWTGACDWPSEDTSQQCKQDYIRCEA